MIIKSKIQSIDSIETYAYKTSKYLVCKKEEIKCSNAKMSTSDDITREKIN